MSSSTTVVERDNTIEAIKQKATITTNIGTPLLPLSQPTFAHLCQTLLTDLRNTWTTTDGALCDTTTSAEVKYKFYQLYLNTSLKIVRSLERFDRRNRHDESNQQLEKPQIVRQGNNVKQANSKKRKHQDISSSEEEDDDDMIVQSPLPPPKPIGRGVPAKQLNKTTTMLKKYT